MKKLIFLSFILIAVSCKKEETSNDNQLYHEWTWVSSSYSEPMPTPLVAPHYYNFQKNGILQVMDTSNVIIYQWQFSIADNQQLSINGGNFKQSYTYSIKNDTLKLVGNIEEIDVETNAVSDTNVVAQIFKIHN